MHVGEAENPRHVGAGQFAMAQALHVPTLVVLKKPGEHDLHIVLVGDVHVYEPTRSVMHAPPGWVQARQTPSTLYHESLHCAHVNPSAAYVLQLVALHAPFGSAAKPVSQPGHVGWAVPPAHVAAEHLSSAHSLQRPVPSRK